MRSFAYIDLVFVDTPLADQTVVRRLETMADKTDLSARIERVRMFLEYIARKEHEELQVSAERGGPFQEGLMPKITSKIQAEMGMIRRKLGISEPHAS